MARMQKTAATQADRDLPRRVLVKIGGDITSTLSRVVWQHEVPILEEIWGEGNVVEIDPAVLDDGYTDRISADLLPHNKKQDRIQRPSEVAGIGFVFVGDARSEYDRLAEVYGRHTDHNIPYVEHVYGRFQERRFERMLGLPEFSDMPDAQLREIAIDHGHLPSVNQDSTKEERLAQAEERRKLFSMSREQLLELVTNLAGELA